MRELDVRIDSRPVGVLRDRDDTWEFEYTPEWIEAGDAFDLSPALPRASARHVDGSSRRSVQWYFDNLLPEEGMRTVAAQEARVPEQDAFGLLAFFGAESAGALVLQDPARPLAADRGLKKLPYAALSERIGNMARVPLSHDAPKRMSIAGAQHKLLVVMRDGALFEPLPGTPSTHILKPEHLSDDDAASVANEYFTMRLARAMRLEVPEVEHLCVPQPIYIVRRFDRTLRDAGAVQRRHAIDTCQLLDKSRAFKYTAATVESVAQASVLCRARAVARLQLFRWIVFNVLVGNGDCHLKNISFLVDDRGIDLAPFYDLLSTAAYDTKALRDNAAHWPHTHLAIGVGACRTFAEVDRASLLGAGATLGLARNTASRELDLMLERILPAADALLAECERDFVADALASADPAAAMAYVPQALRTLRAIRYIILRDMVDQLTNRPR